MRREALELWENSASGWIDSIAKGDINRTHLLDLPMLELCSDVRGRNLLDVGCGEGRFCRMLAERGATCIGVEPTCGLVDRAFGATFVRASGSELPFAGGSFDVVVCYLVLIDIEDYRGAIFEMSRVLKPNGLLVIANLNSFATCLPRPWIRDANGHRLYFALDNYFASRPQSVSWGEINVINFHRPFESYLQTLIGCGLRLEHFAEPRPTNESVQEHPSMSSEQRVPLFHVMKWRKA